MCAIFLWDMSNKGLTVTTPRRQVLAIDILKMHGNVYFRLSPSQMFPLGCSPFSTCDPWVSIMESFIGSMRASSTNQVPSIPIKELIWKVTFLGELTSAREVWERGAQHQRPSSGCLLQGRLRGWQQESLLSGSPPIME